VGTCLTDCGKKVKITLTSFLIEEAGGNRKVLVDTGPDSPERSFRVHRSGDYEVCDGIRVVLTPGHTPGSRSVIVRTSGGRIGLAGDNVFFFENLEKNLPVGHRYSRASWFESMDRLRALTDLILPSHDPLLFRRDPPVYP
jgi:glyoxylase-like metal-dependent hydrolase (beta-lactamase superfamily II)